MRGLALLLAVIAAFAALAGCDSNGRQWPNPSPAIWEVRAPNGERGWLFGTIHALPDGAEWQTPAIDAALAQAGLLTVEIADLQDHERGQRALARRSRSDGLPPLSQRVPPQDRPRLQALMDRAGLDDSDFRGVKSWAAALMLANALSTGDAGNGVDRALLSRKIPVIGLESFEAQFARFDALPDSEQADLLLSLEAETADGRADGLQEAWLTGDTGAIERLSGSGLLADPELREALLTARNRAWLPTVAAQIEAGKRPFVAVGAAHMAGPDGLPELLAARGFTVSRLR